MKRRVVLLGLSGAAVSLAASQIIQNESDSANSRKAPSDQEQIMKNLRPVAGSIKTDGKHWVGDGFHVDTMFSPFQVDADITSPFILMDYAEPEHFSASDVPRGVGEHPHRGFETVTFAYQGEVSHRDSSGGGGTIFPGDVQWMTAGSGVVHEEFHSKAFTERGGTMEMVQLWVNLPKVHKMTAPRYQGLLGKDFPKIKLGDVEGRLMAGEIAGQRGTAKTYSPITVFDFVGAAGQKATFELPAHDTLMVFIMKGTGTAQANYSFGPGQLFIFERGENIPGQIAMELESDSRVLVLSGTPLNEPVAARGPFVMNTQEELMQAFMDYRAGKMGKLPVKTE